MNGTYSVPGVSDFKVLYDRDFPFSSEATNATATALADNTGALVSVTPNCLGNGYASVPFVQIFDANDGPGFGGQATATLLNAQIVGYTVTATGQSYVSPVVMVTGGGVDPSNMDFVRDSDVIKALTAAGVNFNCAFWMTQDEFNYAYLLKAAHFLCINLKASTQGLRGRGGEWLRQAFNVGDIGSTFQFHDRIARSRILAPLMETTYGSQYLQLIGPKLVANVRAVVGHTKP